MAKRRKLRRRPLHDASRRLQHETLEKRELLAAGLGGFDGNGSAGPLALHGSFVAGAAAALSGPRLVGVSPDAEGLLSEVDLNRLTTAPKQLTFRFDGKAQLDPSTLDGIQLLRAGGDDSFDDGNEQVVVPGYLALAEDSDRIVVMRFAQSLPDDRYRIRISGIDDASRGLSALRSSDGTAFRTIDGQPLQTIDFDLELGAKVTAVVPQPIAAVDGTLVRRDREIDVYFDDADLFRTGSNVATPAFYQLVDTQNTVTTQDDMAFLPDNVLLDPAAKKVTLQFSDSLENLVPGTDSTSFRLRIGDDARFETRTVVPFSPFFEPGITAATASDLTPSANLLATAGSWSVLVNQQISNNGLQPLADNPGALDEIGHREIEVEQHIGGGDSDNQITQIPYTFLRNQSYGLDANGDPVYNQMNEAQEQRFKEVLELYGEQFGIDFYETESSGLQLIVGDLFVADSSRVSGPGGVAGLGGPGGVIMDFADFTTSASNRFGGGFFNVALHEIGHAIGMGHSYDLPGAVQGGGGGGDVFPSPHDLVHGEFLHQKEALDVDLYRIDITEVGTLSAQTVAERLANASLLDTRLTLFRQNAQDRFDLVAANDDYFGTDSMLEIEVQPGTYFVGVAAEGNPLSEIESGQTSEGGVSEGQYDLRVEFQPRGRGDALTDAAGTIFDGDRDGTPGGNYSFWFEAARPQDTLYVRKPDNVTDAGGDGTLARPFDNIDDALAVAATKANAVVRVLANDGLDNDVTTLEDNEAYELGFSSVTGTLDDGRNLIVPANTTLMIDAGVIIKSLDARISVGSDVASFDRSGSSIQVLGTPDLPVYFTSYNDPTKGTNVNPVNTTPAAGDWGGIEIRNDVDRAQGRSGAERRGIFQNYINHASFEFGGGQVSTVNRVIDPIYLSQARAEVSYNTITHSDNAAVSADPDTFEVSAFTAERFQRNVLGGVGFVPDYDRVGPDIYGNTLLENRTNGLFVRIDTLPGNRLETLQVSARFDDTDIPHVLVENLLLQGQPGGPMVEQVRPSQILGLTDVGGGAMTGGTYRYAYTFVDAFGNESVTSLPQVVTVSGVGRAVQLTGITAATGDFVGRRLYRSDNGGTYRLIAELDGSQTTHLDRAALPAATAPTIDTTVSVKVRSRPDAGLIVDPGMIIKVDESRIELGFGTTLVAEGHAGNEVIFTSLNDDRYGAGGTFDTNNASVAAAAADWAGIYANRTSRVSLDHAVLAYGGGVTGVGGSTAGFNVLEIHQAEARVANSRFEYNAGGSGGQSPGVREGRLSNSFATIHVAGAQPTIVDSTFVHNRGAAINIDVNSLNSFLRDDGGRQTGAIDLYDVPVGNAGPIFRGNRLDDNDINGLQVRGGTLFTESVWDDTDIVHVVRGDIVTTNFHTYGGLRLESSSDESLVVKLDNDAQLLATGATLDITDRIGGRIQVLGTPGHPVVLTSLNDTTAGAGFTPDGQFQVNTWAGSQNQAAPGDWQGIRLDPSSHDRNLDTVKEYEKDADTNSIIGNHQRLGELAPDEFSGDETRRLGFTILGKIGSDSDQDIYSFEGTAGTMVWLDIDRTDEALDTVLEFLDGDGNVLALSDDSRNEMGGLTYVNPLDPNNGDFIGFAPGHALPMPLNPDMSFNAAGGGNRDLYSLNNGDAGMRVVLPGVTGSKGTYYVRVRSSNPANLSDPAQIQASVADGQTSGAYQLQIRLRETDEIGGSVIRYADIRYATIGIEAIGLPAHSPLAGELYNPGGNVNLGSLANTDRGAISVGGQIDNSADSYTFTVGRDGIQGVPGGANAAADDHKVSTVIDVDYADGLSRPNTGAFLYHDGQLVAIGTDSNVLDDRNSPEIFNQVSDPNELSSGSFGVKDPFIGPLELSTFGTYEVVIANNSQIPPELRQFTDSNPPNSLVRLEPLDSTIRIADDRFDVGNKPLPESYQGPRAVQVAFEDNGSNVLPWHLGDIPLIGLTETNASDRRLSIFNPFTGRHDAVIDRVTDAPIGAIAASLRGDIIAIRDSGSASRNDANTSTTYRVNPDGTMTALGATGIVTYEYFLSGANHTNRVDNEGMEFSALAFYNDNDSQTRFLYGLANRGTFEGSNVGSNASGADIIAGSAGSVDANNLIYRLDPDSGTAISRNGDNMPGGFESANPRDSRILDNNGIDYPAETPWAGTNVVAQIQIPTTSPTTGGNTGDVVDIIADPAGGTSLYAFTETGAVWEATFSDTATGNTYAAGDIRGEATLIYDPTTVGAVAGTDFIVDPSDATGTPIVFENVTRGPANYQHPDSDYDVRNLIFGVGQTAAGVKSLYAFDIAGGEALGVFRDGATSMPVDTTHATGDFNALFFSSLDQSLWHVSDTLENAPGHGMPELDNQARPRIGGGASLRFGFDALNDDYNHLSSGVVDNDLDASDLQDFQGYNFLGGAHGTVQSNTLDLTGIVAEDLPTLYFTYLLDSEGRNSGNRLDQQPMRDSLRVFVAGDDGDWQLVATNNFDADAGNIDYSPEHPREYDSAVSGYGNKGSNRRYVQQLFDGDEFRQARIDLGPWAGQQNVTIRYEFSTAGESRPDQSEIVALAGNMIDDGHTITIRGDMPDKDTTNRGDALPTLTKVFEFDVAGDGISATSDAAITIDENMTVAEVRDAIQQALANEIRFADAVANWVGNYSTNSFPVVGDAVRMYDLEIDQTTSGRSLKLVQGEFSHGSSNLPANQFGLYQDGVDTLEELERAGQRTMGLGGDHGVYIDDIVIGLAERGESVGGAGTQGSPRTSLTSNPFFQPEFNELILPEIVAGAYQAEVRLAREYGNPNIQDTEELGKLGFARVELNERLAEGLNLEVVSAGRDINDGDLFTLSNGADTLTFEFNSVGTVAQGNVAVPFTAADIPSEVASSIRNAINTVAVNGALGILATNRGGQLFTTGSLGSNSFRLPTDPVVVIHGFAAANNLGGLNFGPHIDAQLTGQDIVFGEDNGDLNLHRDQGQLLIESNLVSNSAGYGIVVDAGPVAPVGPFNAGNQEGNRPKPGAVLRLPTLNTTEQIPGAVVRSNLLYNNRDGILLSGDTSTGAPSAFSRVLNNTIYGSGTGIRVEDGASPALLNNVLMENSVGIAAAGQGETLVRGNLYERNGSDTQNIGVGTEAIIDAGVPLFVNPVTATFDPTAGQPNFYPVAGSPVINNSIPRQDDRPLLASVKQVVGIPESPILVSERDLYGQPRGQLDFADRGAVDRLDQQGPSAQLIRPLDNDAVEVDSDPTATVVQLTAGELGSFDILLTDERGTGPNAATVTSEQFRVTENGRLLQVGTDYTFAYNSTSQLLRITPLAGVWRQDSVYEITLNNRDRIALEAPAGAVITDTDQFSLVDSDGAEVTFEFDSGYVLQLPEKLSLGVTGDVTQFNDASTFTITAPGGSAEVTFEFEKFGGLANGSNVAIDLTTAVTATDIRDAILAVLDDPAVKGPLNLQPVALGSTQIHLGAISGHAVTETLGGLEVSGSADGIVDGDRIAYTTAAGETTFFQFRDVGYDPATVTPAGDVVIELDRRDSTDQQNARIVAALKDAGLGLTTARVLSDGRIYVGGRAGDVFQVLEGDDFGILGTPGVTGGLTLSVPDTATSDSLDGQTFAVTVAGTTTTFEFSTDPGRVTPNRMVVLPAGVDAAAVATLAAGVIGSQFGQLSPAASGTVITLNEPSALTAPLINVSLDPLASLLTVAGVDGGAVPISYVPALDYSADAVAGQVIAAITRSGLRSSAFAAGGGAVYLDATASANGLTNEPVGAIRDLSGNPLQANRRNRETQFTILMPGVQLDFGDAPDRPAGNPALPPIYPTLTGNNGARHTLGGGDTLRLGAEIDTELDGQPIGDDDAVDAIGGTADASFVLAAQSANELRVELAAAPVVGDTLTVSIGSVPAFTLELVFAGQTASGTNVPVLFSPDEPATALLDRLDATLESEYRSRAVAASLALRTSIDRVGDAVVIRSVDDEDGVNISTLADGVDGLFLDPDGNVLGLLNPLDDRGSEISVTVAGSGLLDAWIDFNQDGDWNDAGEQILRNAAVLDGDNRFLIDSPAAALEGLTWARFRLSTTGNLRPDGVGIGGEVEDYQVRVTPFQLPEPIDDGGAGYETDEDTTLVSSGSVLDNDILSPNLINERAELVDDVENGSLVFNADGTFTYTPNADFNGTDTFTYRVKGDRVVNTGATPPPSFEATSATVATVTITINPVNDLPEFTLTSPVDVLEQDDQAERGVQVLSDIRPGPVTATDEAGQSVAFNVTSVAANPADLLIGNVTIDSSGVLHYTTSADAVGTFDVSFTATDGETTTPVSTMTVNVRPVNDAPRIDPAVADTPLTVNPADADDAYSVDANGQITYVLREDNTQAGGAAAPYVIDLRDTSGAAYGRVGLEDVFLPGPANEAGQSIRVDSFDTVSTITTDLGGTVTAERDLGGNLVRLLYMPPADANNPTQGLDSFTYSVIDDGQSWDLGAAALVDDFQSTTNRVFLQLQPVNDAPQFNQLFTEWMSGEDDPEVQIQFADNVTAGPLTAIDENDATSGQNVSFVIEPVDAANAATAARLFGANQPQIAADGTLTYTAVPDQVGSVMFNVRLLDDGVEDPARGDLNQSPTVPLTIHVQPQNDPPVIDPAVLDTPLTVNPADPDDAYSVDGSGQITYVLREDNTQSGGVTSPYVIDLRDTSGAAYGPIGLEDVFLPGPAEEVATQTIRVNTFDSVETITTDLGGTVTAERDLGGNLVRLLYVPPADANNPTQGLDSFTYSVIDDGQSWDTASGMLVDDFLTAENRVFLQLQPVNDAPEFNQLLTEVTSLEDLPEVQFQFANNVSAGPPATAIDETDAVTGQSVSFLVEPVDAANAAVAATLFGTNQPEISPDGTLRYTAVADQFGSVTFNVTLFDDGVEDLGRGDIRRSSTVPLTIHVQPQNDSPVIDPAVLDTPLTVNPADADDAYRVDGNGQITYVLREDNTQPGGGTSPFVIDLRSTGGGTYGRIGLEDVFLPGPANEANQDVRVNTFDNTDTITTDLGGTVTAQRDTSGNLVRLLYVPPTDLNSNMRGSDSFTYSVIDDGQSWDTNAGMLIDDFLTAENRVFLQLNPVNDAPQFNQLMSDVTSLEDQPVVRVQFADSVTAGPPLTATDETDFVTGQNVSFLVEPVDAANAAIAATLFGANQPEINRDGTLSYTAAPDQFGSVTFNVTLLDDGAENPARGDINRSQTVSLTITVQPQNDAPRFANDLPVAFDLDEDTSILIPYRALPGEPQGMLDKFLPGPANEIGGTAVGGNQTLSLGTPILASTVAGGTLTPVTENGRQFLRYTPKADFNGLDTFAYSVIDDGVSVDADGNVTVDPKRAFFSVELNVRPVNDPPQFGGAGNVSVDEDAGENDPQVPPADVGLTVIPDWATNIQPGPPGAVDEAQSQTVTFTVTPATAADAALAAQIFVADNNGEPDVTVDSQGTLRFQTLPDANGDVTFTIVADDNSGQPLSTSPVKTFTISVRPVNDPPTFTPGASTVSHDEDSGTYSDVWATDISAGPFEENTGVQTVRFDVSIDPADAALFQIAPTIDDSGVLRFVPAPDANGTATVTVRAIDSAGGISDPVLFDIIINPVVDTPTAVDDVFEVDEDTVRTLLRQELLDNDIDPDLPDDVLTISLVSTVTRSGASVTLDSDNNVVYDPTQSSVLQSLAPGETATDTFSYVLIDSFGRVSQPAVVSMIVSGVNDAPQLLPDNPDVQPTGSTILRPLDNDSDIDGTLDVSTLEITLDPAFGSVTLPGDGTIIYTPYAGFRGTDTLRYTVKDNLGAAGPETLISIRANAAPVAADDRGGTFQNEAVDIDVLANDSDPDGDDTLNPDSIVIVRQPTSGTAFALGGGLVRYVPAEGFNGNDSFTYTVSDNLGRPSEPATVRVQVVSSRAQNPLNNMDVSGDGEISPIDALLTVNLLNRLGTVNINNAGVWQPDETYALGDIVQVGDQSWLAEGTPTVGQQPGPGTVWGEVGKPFYDVDGNRRIEPLDVLTVVNELNRRARQGQGSGQGEAVAGLERRSEEETQVALDLAHTLPPAPLGKLVSTDAAVVEVADLSDDDQLFETLARDKSSEAAAEDEVVVDSLWRHYR